MTKTTSQLQDISPDDIRHNPDNPRLIFREDEMLELLESIREVGIKVPISVYLGDHSHYVILDGERRWRCSKKLNLKTIPCIVQPKPNRLENLLMMFNIHNVRVDWDLMPMALKLGQIRDMLIKEGKEVTPRSLATITGVRFPTVQRALDLLDLPSKYQTMLLKEAEKPKSEQRIKPDLFIETYKALHVIERHAPEAMKQFTKQAFVDTMVHKYMDGVIDNVVGFRDISKIARAELAGVDKNHATPVLVRLVKDKKYSIKQAFEDTVETAYDQRNLVTKIAGLCDKLRRFKSRKHLNSEVIESLQELKQEVGRLLN